MGFGASYITCLTVISMWIKKNTIHKPDLPFYIQFGLPGNQVLEFISLLSVACEIPLNRWLSARKT